MQEAGAVVLPTVVVLMVACGFCFRCLLCLCFLLHGNLWPLFGCDGKHFPCSLTMYMLLLITRPLGSHKRCYHCVCSAVVRQQQNTSQHRTEDHEN